MEVLSNWQNIKWNKHEEIIVKWLTIDIYSIMEMAMIELELSKKGNRSLLKNLIFNNEALEELNSEMANEMIESNNCDCDFIKKWRKNTIGLSIVEQNFDDTNIEKVTYLDDTQIIVIDDYIRTSFSTRPPTPPIRIDSRKKPLLVLDLDETLIHSSTYPINTECIYIEEFGYYVYKRPFLDYFLTEVSKYYDIGIWSAGTDDYVETIIDMILPVDVDPIFVFGRSMCQLKNVDGYRVFVKPLRILQDFGYCLSKMLIVDDTPQKCVENFGNAIIPNPYLFNTSDRELLDILAYLVGLKGSEDFTNHQHYKWKQIVMENKS